MTAMDRKELRGISINGLVISMSSQILRFVLQFAYQIFIARLLAPGDFGLVAMTAPIIAFVQLFADLGLSQATIQRAEINQQQLSFMFWMNVAVGCMLAMITIISAPLIGWFYGDSRVVPLTIVFGGLFILGGACSQHIAILNRNMKFLSLALLDFFSFAAGAVGGIVCALITADYWAIAANQIVVSTMSLALAWMLSGWIPSGPRRAEDSRALLSFGGNLTGFNLANYFARNLDNVLVGRIFGDVSLGLYDRAYKLLLLPLNQISYPLSRVVVPLLSKLQNDPDAYKRVYTRMLEFTMLLTFPGVIFAMITSTELVRTLLGEKWVDIAPIFSILAISALTASVGNSTGWLFISQGRTRDMRNAGVVSSALYVASFIAGLPWGPIGVAAAYTLMCLFRVPVLCRIVTTKGPVSASDLAYTVLPYLVASLATSAAVLSLNAVLLHGMLSLLLLFSITYSIFLIVLLTIPHSRLGIIDISEQAAMSSVVGTILGKLRQLATKKGK